MKACRRCGSFAINPQTHGRVKGIAIDLCDVCYWREIAEKATSELDAAYLELRKLSPAIGAVFDHDVHVAARKSTAR